MNVRILITLILVLLVPLAACAGQPAATPTQQPAKATAEASKPAAEATKPAPEATKPAATATKPAEPAAKPAAAKPDPSVEAFYKGKTVTIIAAGSAGGGQDTYARLLARQLGKHIPGNPTVIVQNMPGAGGMIAMNHLYNAAAKDGTVIGIVTRGAPQDQLIQTPGVQYDAAKFNWIGNMNEEVAVCVARSDSGVAKYEDLLTKTLRVGGTAPTQDSDMFPAFFNAVLGTKLDLISGYPGSSEIALAVDQGELQGMCGFQWSSMKKLRSNWFKEGFAKILFQIAPKKHKELPDVPLLTDFVKDEKARGLLNAVLARQLMGRPFVAPPGVPAERVQALRKAFMDTVNDPQLLEEAEKTKTEVIPMDGEELQKIVEDIMKTPKDQVDLLAKYLKVEAK